MVQGKAKGNKYEIKIWRDLQSVFPDIRRISASGSMKDDKGDLESKDFVFECKHRKNISKGDIDAWFKEIWRIAEKKMKLPVLIYRKNYKPIRVMHLTPNLDDWVVTDSLFSEWKKKQ